MVPKEVEGCQPKHITVEVPIDAPGKDVIARNIPGNIGARKREVSAGHRAVKVDNLQEASVDELLAQRKVPSMERAKLNLKAEPIKLGVPAACVNCSLRQNVEEEYLPTNQATEGGRDPR